MSIKQQALRYERSIRGLSTQNNKSSLYSMAGGVMLQTRPLPPIDDYDFWLGSTRSSDPRGAGRHKVIDGRKLRRLAEMRRNGCDYAECGASIGISTACAHRWHKKMPPELTGGAA